MEWGRKLICGKAAVNPPGSSMLQHKVRRVFVASQAHDGVKGLFELHCTQGMIFLISLLRFLA